VATPSHAVAVRTTGLGHRYGDRVALRGLDLEVGTGAVHAFLGPNGSGKSTLFKILATILPPSEGRVEVLGHDLATDHAAVRRRIGVVFQSPALDRKLSVRANLRYAGHMQGMSGQALEARIDAILAAGRLADRAKDKVETLSGGLRRRVEIAKALLHEPSLLLLDEPSTGLDPGARRDFWRMLREAAGNPTILFTTHLMDEAADADRITLLHEGAVVAEGTPADLEATVGGQVLEVAGSCADEVEAMLRERGGEPVRVDGHSRVRLERADTLVGELLDRFGDRIDRVSVSRPSLEDVFFEKTGRSLDEEGGD
jgi:ABC-2 type transport system ATP-binding protein